MTSPTLTSDGLTGWTRTSDPFWMLGSIEPPVTTKVERPETRIAAKARQSRKSTAKAIVERMFPRFLAITVLSFLSVRLRYLVEPASWVAVYVIVMS